jgi:photosystem II stability/assembly factor-like uncharacterized protein
MNKTKDSFLCNKSNLKKSMKRKFTKVMLLGVSLLMTLGHFAQNPLWRAYGNNMNTPKGIWLDIKVASATNVLVSGRDHGGNNYPVIRGFNSTTSPLNMSNSTQRFTNLSSSQRINSLSMNDNTNGWAIYVNNTNTQAYLLNTSDAGLTWSQQQLFTGSAIAYHTVCRVNSTVGYVYLEGSTIKKTIDGGANFTDQTLPGNPFIPKIYFFDDQIGWVLGFSGEIYHTSDGGANWVAQSSGVTTPLKNAHFISSTEGWVVGNNNVILHTTDGGATWTPQTITTTNVTTINDVHFTSATTGYIVGNYLLRGFTTDGGNTWNIEYYDGSSSTNEYTAVDFLTPDLGFVLNSQGFIFKYCPGYAVNTSFTACEGSYFGNQYLTTSGTYTEYFQSIGGCDSIVTANITVVPPPATGTDVQSACGSFTWIDGVTYTTSTNTPTYWVQSANGCDSLVNLNLTIGQTTTGEDQQNTCGDPFTWIDGVTYTTSNSTATYILTNAAGCDSIVTLDLTINDEVATIISNGNSLVCTNLDGIIQWVDCDNANAPIVGADNNTFTPSVSGNYAAQLDFFGCTTISNCINITVSSINESSASTFTLYPNPTNDIVNLENLKAGTMITVYDVTGKVVYSELVSSTVSVIATSAWENGLYLVQTTYEGLSQQTKLVVNK